MTRRRLTGGLVAVAAALSCLALGAGPASAARTHVFQRSFPPEMQYVPEFITPQALAVDQANGDFYVMDTGTGIKKFDASGARKNYSSTGTNVLDPHDIPEPGFTLGGPSDAQLAVDNSGTATDEDLYVTNTAYNVVNVFDGTGTYIDELTTAAAPLGPVCGVAVGPTGTVYVGDSDGTIARFVPSGGPVTDADYDAEITGLSSSCNLAVDSTGAVYATPSGGAGALIKYAASDFGAVAPAGATIDANVNVVAVDPSTDDVYADSGEEIRQYDPSGTLIGTSGAGRLTNSYGVAVGGPSDGLYAVGGPYYSAYNDLAVFVFGPLVSLADVTTGAVSAIQPQSATVAGTVVPDGRPTTYQVEYGTTTAYGSAAPTAAGDAGSAPSAVSANVSAGLAPDTTYHYRLAATNADGTAGGADATFTTTGPVATVQTPTDVTTTSATFHGTLDMRGLPGGRYHFAVTGTDSLYGGASAEAAVPGGSGTVPVSGTIGDLPAGGQFTVRLVADTPLSHDYSATMPFQSVAAPAYVPPPAAVPSGGGAYGCTAPHLDALSRSAQAGEELRVTGSDLGVGATALLGGHATAVRDYSAQGFTIGVPAAASGTLALTINCGTVSNTVGVIVPKVPSNVFTTKVSVKSTTASVAVKVPGAGRLRATGSGLVSASATAKAQGTTTLRLRLTTAGRRKLAQAKSRRLAVVVSVRFTPTGGTGRTTTKTITFKRGSSR